MPSQIVAKNEQTVSALELGDGRSLSLDRPLVMGILNVTPDSFSDGGSFDTVDTAVAQALRMISDGADIIDIGGESTRPGAEPVSADTEQSRVLPVIKAIRGQSKIPISIDTYHSDTAALAIDAGADIINDISAMRFDPRMPSLISKRKLPVVLMHMKGVPQEMQKEPHYDNCVQEIIDFFNERTEYCLRNGIERNQIILDPGIGFGKRLEDNLAILSNLKQFVNLGQPILVGASRKSFIGALSGTDGTAEERIGGSVAAALLAVAKGASIVRVHDVAPTVEALTVAAAIEGKR